MPEKLKMFEKQENGNNLNWYKLNYIQKKEVM